jgi:hypothetical protein
VASRAFAEGDRVIATRNDNALELENGTQGVVTHLDEDLALGVALDDGRQVTIPASYLQAGHVDHAYALTVYKAQGATVERAHFIGSEDLYREEGYTALTRSREESHFYVLTSRDEQRLPGLTVSDKRLEEVLGAMTQSRSKEYATRLRERIAAAAKTSDIELAEQATPFGQLASASRRETGARELVERRERELRADQARLAATRERLADTRRRSTRNRDLRELEHTQIGAVEQAEQLLADARETLAANRTDHDALIDAAAARNEQRRRERQRTLEAADQAIERPGPHVLELIGERRETPDVEIWDQAARRIEAYHHTYGPDSRELHLPTRSAPRHQRRDFEILKDAVTRARGEDTWTSRLPSLTPDRGPDLGPDLGP